MRTTEARVDAAIELLEQACDGIRDVVFCNRFYSNDHDIRALLVDVYCR